MVTETETLVKVRPVGRHPTAVIGSPPEHRDWSVGDPVLFPKIAESARLSAFVTVDGGLREPTRVGARSFLMAHVHVGHDAQIGDDCELAPGTVICGHVVLEDNVRCGVGVLIRPFIRVGKGARLGAGAVVVKDVPTGEVWAGNPAKQLRKKPVVTGEFLTDSEVEGWEEFADRLGAHLTPIWRHQPNHGSGIFVMGLDPRDACYVLANGAKVDGKTYRVSFEGCDGKVQGDGRVAVRFEEAP